MSVGSMGTSRVDGKKEEQASETSRSGEIHAHYGFERT